jgi:hypothetical protein
MVDRILITFLSLAVDQTLPETGPSFINILLKTKGCLFFQDIPILFALGGT